MMGQARLGVSYGLDGLGVGAHDGGLLSASCFEMA